MPHIQVVNEGLVGISVHCAGLSELDHIQILGFPELGELAPCPQLLPEGLSLPEGQPEDRARCETQVQLCLRPFLSLPHSSRDKQGNYTGGGLQGSRVARIGHSLARIRALSAPDPSVLFLLLKSLRTLDLKWPSLSDMSSSRSSRKTVRVVREPHKGLI